MRGGLLRCHARRTGKKRPWRRCRGPSGLVHIERSHDIKVDTGTAIARLTGLLELFPYCFDLRRRVIRNVGTLPGEDFHKVRTAFLVGTAKNDMGVVQDEAQTGIHRPGFRDQSGIFRLVSGFDERDAVNGLSFAPGELGGDAHSKQ